ncbi:plasmid mobilization relaxosome protein MobC [uncultured Hoeflea sp.]|uniref:plasmid mobilization protein n=1 Tax=uncultured Hoeflea sp. TaxID=538666 RepID=UPI0030D953B1|tara:strand:- start:107 stop:430 length:324 start_codon:yes stop_codon:yes gene_type:complete
MRSQVIRVRTSQTEFTTIKDTALARGLTISELVRRSAMAVRMPVRLINHIDANLLVRTLGEIGHIGGNLNQMVRRAHAGKLAGHDVELSQTLAEIDALRNRIRDIVG